MAKAKKRDPETLTVNCNESERGDSREEINSKLVIDPSLQAACTLRKLSADTAGQIDLTRSMKLAIERAERVNKGNLSELEDMLTNQASTLDVVFNTLARRSALNMGEYMGAAETYMKLALRAQAQCRSTIEALAEIKNPKPVFVSGQTNISNGHQQVNNSPRAAENQNAPNEQSEDAGHELHQNRGTQAIAGRKNPTLETMGAINRTKVG